LLAQVSKVAQNCFLEVYFYQDLVQMSDKAQNRSLMPEIAQYRPETLF